MQSTQKPDDPHAKARLSDFTNSLYRLRDDELIVYLAEHQLELQRLLRVARSASQRKWAKLSKKPTEQEAP